MEEKIIKLISEIDEGFGTTNQLYGIPYILISGKKELKELRKFCLDLILSSVAQVPGKDDLYYIADNYVEREYYVSRHYNFSLNVLSYVALKKVLEEDSLSKEQKKKILLTLDLIVVFLNYEVKFLEEEIHKTVGFELVVGKYISSITGFKNLDFIRDIQRKRNQRLKEFSPLLAFSPEGLDGLFNKIKATAVVNRVINRENQGVFILNSPETTIAYSHLINKSADTVNDFKNYVFEKKGLPPFFKSEISDIFWIIEAVNAAGLITENLKAHLIHKIKKMNLVQNSKNGTFDKVKGFSIAKGFPLYDSDTTAVALKSFSILGIYSEILKEYDFSYYKGEGKPYHVYGKDNRPSLSTLGHILSALVRSNKLDLRLIEYINQEIDKGRFKDKWHISKLYTCYCVILGLVDLVNYERRYYLHIEKVVDWILTFQKEDGSFTSLNFNEGTLEETCWAFLGLYYCYTSGYLGKVGITAMKKTKKYIDAYVSTGFDLKRLERLWVVKEKYYLVKLMEILVMSSYEVKL